MLKKVLISLTALLLFTGCAPRVSNTLNLSPQIASSNPDPSLMAKTISIGSTDGRADKALAKVERDGKLVTLTSSRDPAYLMQEALDKQMRERGYMVSNIGNNDATLHLTINELYADVSEGNLRYLIDTTIDISIQIQARNGAGYTKTYRTTHSVQGALTANNKNITNVLNQALTQIFAAMAKDPAISDFIKQNSR